MKGLADDDRETQRCVVQPRKGARNDKGPGKSIQKRSAGKIARGRRERERKA